MTIGPTRVRVRPDSVFLKKARQLARNSAALGADRVEEYDARPMEQESIRPLEAKWAAQHFRTLRDLDRSFFEMTSQLDGAMTARQASGGLDCQRPIVKWLFEHWEVLSRLQELVEWTGGCPPETTPVLDRLRTLSRDLLAFAEQEFRTRESKGHYQKGLRLLLELRAICGLTALLRRTAEDLFLEPHHV